MIKLINILIYVCLSLFAAKVLGNNLDQLNISVKTEPHFIPAEKISFNILIKNNSPNNISFHKILEVSTGFIEVKYRIQDEKDWKDYSDSSWGIKKVQIIPTELKAGEIVQSEVYLYSSEQNNFLQPNIYQLKVRVWNIGFKECIESSVFEIKIVASEGNNLKFWEEIKKPFEFSAFLADRWTDIKPGSVDKFRKLAEKYPDSDYAKWTVASLGKYDAFQKKIEILRKGGNKPEEIFYSKEEREKIEAKIDELLLQKLQEGWNNNDWEKFTSVIPTGEGDRKHYKEQKEKYEKAITEFRNKYGKIIGIRISDLNFKKNKVNATISVSYDKKGKYEGDCELGPDKNGEWWINFIDIGLDAER